MEGRQKWSVRVVANRPSFRLESGSWNLIHFLFIACHASSAVRQTFSKSTTQAEKKIKTIRYLEANYLVFDHVWAKGELKWCLCDMLAKSSAPRDFPLLLLFNHSLHAIVEATSSLLDRSGTLCLAAMTWTGIKAKKTARVSTCRAWKLPCLVSRRHRQHVHLLGNAG